MDEISGQSSMKWLKQGRISKSTLCWTLPSLESPKEEGACSLSLVSILQPPSDVPTRYYLSPKACQGILERASKNGKKLPEQLETALFTQSQGERNQ
jgi:hypothetical protein